MRFFRHKKTDVVLETINQIEEEVKSEEIDFTDSMFSDIAEMKLKLENIKSEQDIYMSLQELISDFEKYIQKSTEVMEERKIEEKLQRIKESNIILQINPNPEIPQSMIDRVNQELTIEEYYRNIKSVYEVKYKKATQNILMKKLEKFNTDIDKLMFDTNKLNTISVEELKTYFEILKAKKEEFAGIMQNKYIEGLIELEYKIYMIQMILERKILHYSSRMIPLREKFINKSKITSGRQIIWSRLFIKGVQDFIEKASSDDSKELKNELEKINLQDNKEEILNLELIEKYVNAIVKMQEKEEQRVEQEKKEIQRQEQEQEEIKRKEEEKQELEKFKDLESSEIEEKIKKLDDNNFDIVTSYRNILDYQIKVAKAKGLINERDILDIEDIKIQRIEKSKIPIVLENLKNVICNCEIYTDIDNSKDDVCIVIPKNEKTDLSKSYTKWDTYGYYDRNVKYNATESFMNIFGKYTEKRNLVYMDNKYKMIRCYSGQKSTIESEIKRVKEQWEEENKEGVNKIKFYIEIPYRRTIIPLLEALNKSNIEFTILPIDKNAKMKEPTVKIYMNREDLEKYKEQVHTKISNSEKGIVRIGEEDIDIGELLIEGCEFPFLETKQKEIAE